jgi:sialic acid synthase SpsE
MTERDNTSSSPWQGRFGPLLIAEIGGNHEGDFEYAKKLTRLAVDTGVDFVKFQLYRGDTLVSPVESPDRNNHFKKFELSEEQHLELARMCEAGGSSYMASVWDLEMLDWIDSHLSVYKIGSGDLTAYPVIAEFARRGKPIILSTGLSTLDEVVNAAAFLQDQNSVYRRPEMLALLQCTSMYPIDDCDANLRVMDTLHDATGLAIGYSDHTVGSLALEAATARGAQVLEFHFTDQREGKSFRDHKVSLVPDEVRCLQQRVKAIRSMLGDGVKRPLPCEIENDHVKSFRRAIYPVRDLPKGHTVTLEDLVFLRPNHGVDARDFSSTIGRIVETPVSAFEKL